MVSEPVSFCSMPYGFSLLRGGVQHGPAISALKMTVSKDGTPSLNRLRSMQQSIMRRRKSIACDQNQASDAPSRAEGEEQKNEPAELSKDVPRVDSFSEAGKLISGEPSPTIRSVSDSVSISAGQENSRQIAKVRSRTKEAGKSLLLKDEIADGSIVTVNQNHSASASDLPEVNSSFMYIAAKNAASRQQDKIEPSMILKRENWRLPKKDRSALAGQENWETEDVPVPLLKSFTNFALTRERSWLLPRVNSFQFFSSRPANTELEDQEPTLANMKGSFHSLNLQQQEAVTAELDRACLVLAGPGSGKTRVLTHRAAYLIQEHNVAPYRIMAVTFTNKAADEMKNRLRLLLAENLARGHVSNLQRSDITVGTFHSICARILRVYGHSIGIQSDFQICDASDTRQVVASILRVSENSGDSEKVKTKAAILASHISKMKNNGEEEFRKSVAQVRFREVEKVRAEYDRKLRSMNQLDFDDLLLETRRMLQTAPDVLAELQNRYLHILVDEWQDTNAVQFDIVSILGGKHHNVFVVGDADQSIYKFRGADIRNVARFAESFPNAGTITLEENYRSTECIVNAAQAVIEGNVGRPKKAMRTSNEFGERVVVCKAEDGKAEAMYIVKKIKQMMKAGNISSLSDVAVLYRMNAQTRLIEEACINAGIAYILVAGTRFYERQEVKDILSYLKILQNPSDDLSLLRIINVPPRGLGKKTVDTLQLIATIKDVPVLKAVEAICQRTEVSDSKYWEDVAATFRKGTVKRLADFLGTVDSLRKDIAHDDLREDGLSTSENPAAGLIQRVLKLTDYKQYLTKRSETEGTIIDNKFEERWRNILELQTASARHPTLESFLESVTLMSQPSDKQGEISGEQERPSAVSLMTLHAGKGLEFNAVFIAGVEDGILPMVRRDDADKERIDEERRLAYVGMTRARKYLTLTWRARNFVFASGNPSFTNAKPSRFIADIPKELIKVESLSFRRTSISKSLSGTRVAPKTTTPTTWGVGDSVRCPKNGRGTVITILDAGRRNVEVLFSNGDRKFINPNRNGLELLYSPSSTFA